MAASHLKNVLSPPIWLLGLLLLSPLSSMAIAQNPPATSGTTTPAAPGTTTPAAPGTTTTTPAPGTTTPAPGTTTPAAQGTTTPAAQGTTTPAASGTQSAEALAKLLDCESPISRVPAAGNRKFVVRLDPETIWQPRGGDVKITIEGAEFKPDSTPIVACFRWSTSDPRAKGWLAVAALKTVKKDAGTVTFAATVPASLPDPPTSWLLRFSDAAPGRYTGLFYVIPVADMRVMAAGTDPVDIILPVGITSSPLSFLIAIATVVIAGFALWRIGTFWGIPGRNPILKIISTRAGYASLSQLQIILWTFVVGASAAYVMALSGNLIDIKTGTLILLGITGASTVGAKLQSRQEGQQPQSQSAPALPNRPDKVVMALNGTPAQREVRLTWTAPTSGGPPTSYMVQYRLHTATNDGQWITASNTVTDPRFMVVGLQPGTSYDFQVLGLNAAGAGTPPDPLVTTSTERAGPAPANPPPDPVTALTATTSSTGPSVTLAWIPPAGAPPTHTVSYRIHDSDDPWQDATRSIFGGSFVFNGLVPNTKYDFQVVPTRDNIAGAPVVTEGTAGPHVPTWADLVLDPSKDEIDVTRVQMLFFTLVVASFVTIKVVTSGLIPEIPESFLLLMGISNGVYLTAKFVPSR